MAQLVIRFFYVKYSLIIDFLLVYIGILVHQFLDFNTKIDYETRKYDTVFVLTCLVLFTRVVLNLTVVWDKKKLENQEKKLENEGKKLDNERKEIENEELRLRNELTKKRINKLESTKKN